MVPSNTAFIIGAGAVENAWQPVIDALQPLFAYPMDGDAAYCVLARMVYLMRFYSTGTFPGVDTKTKEVLETVIATKNEIARQRKVSDR